MTRRTEQVAHSQQASTTGIEFGKAEIPHAGRGRLGRHQDRSHCTRR
jgi:hypothetical protein